MWKTEDGRRKWNERNWHEWRRVFDFTSSFIVKNMHGASMLCYAMYGLCANGMGNGKWNGKWVRMDWFVGGLFRVRVEIDFLFFFFSLTSLFVPFCLFAD